MEGPLGNTDIRIINSYPSKVEKSPCERCKSPRIQKSRQKSRQTSRQTSRRAQKPAETRAYFAPGAIEKHVVFAETDCCTVAFPISCPTFVTLA